MQGTVHTTVCFKFSFNVLVCHSTEKLPLYNLKFNGIRKLMGNLCCKKDDATHDAIKMYDPPDQTPLLNSRLDSTLTQEYGGETKHHDHQEYKSFSVDAHDAFRTPSTASVVVPTKNGEKVPEVYVLKMGGSLSNSSFPFSLPSVSPHRSSSSSSSSASEDDTIHRRQRSTTDDSYFEPECIICLDPFTLENPRLQSKCRCEGLTSNPMHLGCLLSWTEQQQEQICPVCRGHIKFSIF